MFHKMTTNLSAVALLCVCSFAIIVVASSSVTPTTNVLGQSGKIMFCPTGECSAERMEIECDFVRELDISGSKVAQHFMENLASSSFTASPLAVVSMGSPAVDVDKVSFSSTFSVGSQTATFLVDTYYFNVRLISLPISLPDLRGIYFH